MENCYWSAHYPGCDLFSTSCGHDFRLDDGEIDESMKFCCFCGKPLVEEPATIEE